MLLDACVCRGNDLMREPFLVATVVDVAFSANCSSRGLDNSEDPVASAA